jgi:hypothetical protein
MLALECQDVSQETVNALLGREIPSCVAAFVKLRCSATATKALSSANWVPRIAIFPQQL